MEYRPTVGARNGKTVVAMDLSASGIGEIIGGSQREERLDILDRTMAERGIDQEHYAWYRDLRRYGTVPHAGFGLGFVPKVRIRFPPAGSLQTFDPSRVAAIECPTRDLTLRLLIGRGEKCLMKIATRLPNLSGLEESPGVQRPVSCRPKA